MQSLTFLLCCAAVAAVPLWVVRPPRDRPHHHTEPIEANQHEHRFAADFSDRDRLDKDNERIVGGMTAVPNSWPWMVSLRYNGGPKCGATVISNRFLLTAAHCFRDRSDVSQWMADLGNHNFDDDNEAGEVFAPLSKVFVHPLFGHNPQSRDEFDVAVVELVQALTYTDKIKPIRVSDRLPKENEMCTVVGWGVTWPPAPYNLLNQVSVPIIPAKRCNSSDFPELAGRITDSMFCAGYPNGGKDSCAGDSGGPIMCQRGGSWLQFGVVSWGGLNCGDANEPGVYARTDGRVKRWIESVVGLRLG